MTRWVCWDLTLVRDRMSGRARQARSMITSPRGTPPDHVPIPYPTPLRSRPPVDFNSHSTDHSKHEIIYVISRPRPPPLALKEAQVVQVQRPPTLLRLRLRRRLDRSGRLPCPRPHRRGHAPHARSRRRRRWQESESLAKWLARPRRRRYEPDWRGRRRRRCRNLRRRRLEGRTDSS